MSFYRQMLVICGAIAVIIALPIIVAKITSVDYRNSVHPAAVFPPETASTLKSAVEDRTSHYATDGVIIPAKATPTLNASFYPESQSAPVFQTTETPVQPNMDHRQGESFSATETVDSSRERITTPASVLKPTILTSPIPTVTAEPSVSSTPPVTPAPSQKPTSTNTPTPTPIPQDIAIIDISHRERGGYAFGAPTDEVRRWQLFTANFYPYLTQVEVRILKWNGTDQSDIVVELYATQNDHPTGFPLASAIIPAQYVAKEAKILSAPLNYNGLVAGVKYAIVLGQQSPNMAHYIWCTGNANQNLSFGKINEESGASSESHLGNGWLQVYTARFPAAANGKPGKPPEIIDISHGGVNGYVFGIPRDEVRRWQTFTLTSHSNLQAVKVKVCKWAVTYQSDLIVELYATKNNAPVGEPLARASVPASFIGNNFTVVKVPLTYQGLPPGTYAIGLGQQYSVEAHYRWCIDLSQGLHFGKINENSISIDETWLGNAWLQVYLVL